MGITGYESVISLAGMLRMRQISAAELVELYLDRISKYDGPGGLNSVCQLDESILSRAREADSLPADKRGPLYGIPILVKDNIDVRGMHTTAGSIALADNLAERDAPLVASLRRQGALVLGKTNMTEFANYFAKGLPNGFSSRGGQVINAYDSKKDPSGSSTGSAVAVSAGLCAAAIGTDTSFSVVGCAAENGVTGLKPPCGALSSDGIIPIARTLDSAGFLTRDLSDALLLYSAATGADFDIKPLKPDEIRLAVNTANQDQVSPGQMQLYDALLETLRLDGGQVCRVNQPSSPSQSIIMRCEFRHDLEAYLAGACCKTKTLADIIAVYKAHPESAPYGIHYLENAISAASGRLDDAEYITALEERRLARESLKAQLAQTDAVLMTGGTNIMHFAGFPSVALQLGMADNGHPRGVILYGADQKRLLAAALTLERYCGTVDPPRLKVASQAGI